MDYYLIGKFVDTHGIKGEIRIIADCQFKKRVFTKGNPIYIGKEQKRYLITGYRIHKQFDLLKLEGINNINEIEPLKGELVYIKPEEVGLTDELTIVEHLIGYKVYCGPELIGHVVDYMKGPQLGHDIIIVGDYRYKIPVVEEFIINIDATERVIKINKIRGLLNGN